jgi:hypothetical protein
MLIVHLMATPFVCGGTEIHQALLSEFSLLEIIYIEQEFTIVNLNPDIHQQIV